MSLCVLHVAYPFAPVGPRAVGGAEQILGDVDRALAAAGHRSLVVACEGSETAGELFSAPMPAGSLDAQGNERERLQWRGQYQETIHRALASRPVNLIHMHGLDWQQSRLPVGIPVLVTLHMPVSWYPERMLQDSAANIHFQCVSEHQLQSFPGLNATVIENGVELPPWETRFVRGDHALALGRICPEKNLHEALEAGTLAGVSVRVGGQVFPYESHQQYNRDFFQPALHADGLAEGVQHCFLGPLLPEQKQRELARARCLLHPTLAPETSSLVAMEALAAGTPVIAYPSGALPDIIEDGVTGFLVNTPAEMAAAMQHLHRIDPEACRSAAERRFSRERMCREYLELYEKLVP